ncbi:hypothetical protein ACU4GA_26455 [Methylobacterium oryzae CBMB20]
MNGPFSAREGDGRMAEAARRYQQAGGSDLVRRLMARPVRLEQQARTRMPLRDPRPADAFLPIPSPPRSPTRSPAVQRRRTRPTRSPASRPSCR